MTARGDEANVKRLVTLERPMRLADAPRSDLSSVQPTAPAWRCIIVTVSQATRSERQRAWKLFPEIAKDRIFRRV